MGEGGSSSPVGPAGASSIGSNSATAPGGEGGEGGGVGASRSPLSLELLDEGQTSDGQEEEEGKQQGAQVRTPGTPLEEAVTPSWSRRGVRTDFLPPPPPPIGLSVDIPTGLDESGGSAVHSPASLGSPIEALRHPSQHPPDDHRDQEPPQQQRDDPQQQKAAQLGVATVLQKIQKWGDYACYGDVVKGSHIIPMKTPLTSELQKGYLPRSRDLLPVKPFTLASFLQDQRAVGRTVGMVVDLSNHQCLYSEDLPPPGPPLVYRHFQFVAKRLPDPDSCTKVNQAIAEFLASHPDEFVAIHCSYGFNRTGFVVCTYLIEELGRSPQEALEAFAESRPPGVKHEDFVQELVARYKDVEQHQQEEEEPPTTSASAAHVADSMTTEGGGGGGGEEHMVRPCALRAEAGGGGGGGDAPGLEQPSSGMAGTHLSPNSTRRRCPTPVNQVHFHEVNNDSLGVISGEALLAEFEKELLLIQQQEQQQEVGGGAASSSSSSVPDGLDATATRKLLKKVVAARARTGKQNCLVS